MMDNNPLISFCVLSYNQVNYIEEALKGASAQTYSPLEIIISDDCSTDGTIEVIKAWVSSYNGPHAIKVNFNKHNKGLTDHFNDIVFNQAQGKFLLVAAGDDISYPERTQISYDFIKKYPNVYIADFSVEIIDEYEVMHPTKTSNKNSEFDINDLIHNSKLTYRGCSRIYRKELFEFFGPLDISCPTEDTPSVMRGLLLGKICFRKEKVLKYRVHSASISAPRNITKLSINQIFKQYRRDLNTAYQQNAISKKQYQQLKRQFSWMHLSRVWKNRIKKTKYFIRDLLHKS